MGERSVIVVSRRTSFSSLFFHPGLPLGCACEQWSEELNSSRILKCQLSFDSDSVSAGTPTPGKWVRRWTWSRYTTLLDFGHVLSFGRQTPEVSGSFGFLCSNGITQSHLHSRWIWLEAPQQQTPLLGDCTLPACDRAGGTFPLCHSRGTMARTADAAAKRQGRWKSKFMWHPFTGCIRCIPRPPCAVTRHR